MRRYADETLAHGHARARATGSEDASGIVAITITGRSRVDVCADVDGDQ